MQLRSLEAFVTVVEQNGFTKAAETLYIGQPALSKTIQKLEQDLDITIFDRSKKKIQLTDEGKVLFEKSKEILDKVASIPEDIHLVSKDIRGEVKVGIPQIIGSVFFPKIAYRFMQKYPKVNLSTEENGGVVIEGLVAQGELDIGFVVLPSSNPLEVEMIYQDNFSVCVPKKHRLATAREISLSELKQEKFILFDKSFTLYSHIRNYCIASGFSPDVAFQSSQWDLVLELVSAQLGITIIPQILANKLNGIEIVSIPIKNPQLKWSVGIITKKNAYQSHALKEFINVVREIYQTE